MKRLISPTGKDIRLPQQRPNAGIEAAYQREVDQLVADMHASIVFWIKAAYKKTPPVALAMDDAGGKLPRSRNLPARKINQTIEGLTKRWSENFAERAHPIAVKFALGAAKATDGSFQRALKSTGITVKFTTTRAQNDAVQAKVAENVGLIKSIAAQHLAEVQGMVMRSVQQGRNLGGLVKELQAAYGVTRRRAAIIAQDQNNKATALITKVRRAELGITEAEWIHNAAGRTFRPSHVKAHGTRFLSAKGCYIDGEWIMPGEKINCFCGSRSIIPGIVD